MSFELVEVVATAVTAALGVGVLNRIFGRKAPPPPAEKRCTGYRFGRGAINMMRDDCTALRSEDCKDGRCTYHCDQMCRCLAPLYMERK